MPKDILDILRQTNALPLDNYVEQPPEFFQNDSSLDEFFSEIDWILESATYIETSTTQLRKKHSEIISAPQQNEKTKREIGEITDSIEATAHKVHLKLKQMGQMINAKEVESPGSASVQMQRTQHHTATQRFMDVMNSYRSAQTDYRAACKAQIKLKLEIAECPRTDEELDQMLESDNPQIFTQGILMDTQQARQNAADIEARHVDILKLEKSIRELHELFLELAALVESQNELFDRIDHNVSSTKDHVDQAKHATAKAVEYRKKTRKKKIIIIVVAVVVVVLLVAILVGTLVPR